MAAYPAGVPAVLLATDADWIYDEVDAALSGDEITLYRVRRGVDVVPALLETDAELAILDLQIGNMGGMAAGMAVRNEEGMGRLPITAVLMLLDRAQDTFLAHRSDADGWLIKPLDAFRLRRATRALLDGGVWFEGPQIPEDDTAADGTADADATADTDTEPASA
jgi:DNA-binding response OmpR family regulator